MIFWQACQKTSNIVPVFFVDFCIYLPVYSQHVAHEFVKPADGLASRQLTVSIAFSSHQHSNIPSGPGLYISVIFMDTD